MDVTQQQYISAIAREGSLTAAARSLGISQPALSNWLKNLEDQLGIQLVIRSKRHLVLTPAGKIYLEAAERMIAIRERTYARILGDSPTEQEVIRVTGTPNGGINIFSSLYGVFKNRFPAVKLQFAESYNRQSLELVRSGKADFGLCSCLDLHLEGLELVHTSDSELAVMLPRSFPMAYDASGLRRGDALPVLSVQSLRGLPMIMPSEDMSYFDGVSALFREAGFRPEVIYQSSNVRFIYDMIRAGNGAGILPARLFSPLDPVSPFSLEPKLISHAVLVYRKGRQLTEAERFLRDYIASQQRMKKEGGE